MTEQPKDGGAAFPTGLTPGHYSQEGMSLRDWFAAQPDITGSLMVMDKEACEALCGPAPEIGIELFKWQVKVLATLRYIAADAMIAAREATQ